jgi:Fe-S-cluster containining protein
MAFGNYHTCIQQMPKRLSCDEKHIMKIVTKYNHDPFKALRKLFDLMDDLYEFVGHYTPCKKGCSLCCEIPISVSELEVRLIERTCMIKQNSRPPAIVPRSVCPFLEHGSCSIYHHRPFVCRRNVTFDHSCEWCHVDKGKDVAMPMILFPHIEKAYFHILNKRGCNRWMDIRSAFGYKTSLQASTILV